MSIQTVGGIKSILNKYDATEWTKSADLNTLKNTDFSKISLDKIGEKKEVTFGEMLGKSLGEVNNLQTQANVAVQKLVTGESKNIHETMLAVEKAEIAFKTMNQIRMKVIDAYKEVMRMQV